MDEEASHRAPLAASFINFNAFTWAYLTVGILNKVQELTQVQPQEGLPYIALYYYAALCIFNVIGQLRVKTMGRLRFLHVWAAYGGLVTLSPALFPQVIQSHLALFAFILGASVGIGIPSTLAYLSDVTVVEERGTISGATLFASYVSLIALGGTVQTLNITQTSMVYAAWRFSALAALSLRPREPLAHVVEKTQSPVQPRRIRSYVLYLIPWAMFSFTDRSTKPIVESRTGLIISEKDVLGFLTLAGVAAGGLSSLLGGVLSDRFGRKRTITLALAFLGLGYAILGLTPHAPIAQFYFAVANGCAWGVLTCTFFFTIWGDLSPKGSGEKYYSVGVLPFFLASLVSIALADPLTLIGADRVFYVACLLLFLSILPLQLAPETLPQEALERKAFKKYVKKAKRIKDALVKR